MISGNMNYIILLFIDWTSLITAFLLNKGLLYLLTYLLFPVLFIHLCRSKFPSGYHYSSAEGLFFFFLIYLFIYFWLCWVLVSVQGLSLVAASGGHSSSWCAGLSLSRPLLLRSTGSGRAGSVVVAHGLSCSAACGIFPDQGSNPCPPHWQTDS